MSSLYLVTSDSFLFHFLILILDPSEVVFLPSHIIANETFTATLTCMVTGYPPPNVTWYIGSQRLPSDNNGKYDITNGNSTDGLLYNVTSVLDISNVNKRDETEYTCSSENGVRDYISVNRTATSRLTIQGMTLNNS